MPDTAITASNLSKSYLIRHSGRAPYTALRDVLAVKAKVWTRRLLFPFAGRQRAGGPKKREEFWALKDISFEIKQGERIGIIGRNGAGKSTLLKLLSRITYPTEGEFTINGRVASLLEVGTGFHAELTGRENIFLNGAILGMTRAEIKRKFDEIVAFAEIEKFLDTPVKRYSSGMYVRLAFAVAANLEAEILLVDEVLAVGDMAFQKKCLGKMDDVAHSGRTVLFISHQMNHIRKLCKRVFWLDSGKIVKEGPMAEVVGAYESAMASGQWAKLNRPEDQHYKARFMSWEIIEPQSADKYTIHNQKECTIKIGVDVRSPINFGHHGIALWNNDGQLMWNWNYNDFKLDPGMKEFIYHLPAIPLKPGVYHWQVSLFDSGSLLDNWYCVPDFIIATESFQTHVRDEWHGILNIPCKFELVNKEKK